MKIFNEKHKAGETLFQEGETVSMTCLFPIHDSRGKAHAMMDSYCEVEVEEAEKKVS